MVTDLQPDIAAAIDFLQRWQPGGPWVLTFINPEGKGIATVAFDDPGRAAVDIEAYQSDGWNAYFQVNQDRRAVGDIRSKSRKEHIASVVALHVDADPYKGEDAAQGRERILRQLDEDLPSGLPGPPSVIILSGNGYNMLWRLREPVGLSGPDVMAQVEARNRWLGKAFGGDSVFDVCRIMRLAGAVNFPNATKRARGLVPVMSRLVLFDDARLYDLEQFQAATAASSPAVTAEHIQIGSAIGIEDLDELDVPERTKIIIALGAHPDEERESRSEWLFSGICSMIACGVDNETILGVLTDPQWAISESVLEKPNPEDYARRQIVKAHARLTALAAKELIDD